MKEVEINTVFPSLYFHTLRSARLPSESPASRGRHKIGGCLYVLICGIVYFQKSILKKRSKWAFYLRAAKIGGCFLLCWATHNSYQFF